MAISNGLRRADLALRGAGRERRHSEPGGAGQRATCSRAWRARAAGPAPGAWRARPRGGARVTGDLTEPRPPLSRPRGGRSGGTRSPRPLGSRRKARGAPPLASHHGPAFPSVSGAPGDAGRAVCCLGAMPVRTGTRPPGPRASAGVRWTGPRGGGVTVGVLLDPASCGARRYSPLIPQARGASPRPPLIPRGRALLSPNPTAPCGGALPSPNPAVPRSLLLPSPGPVAPSGGAPPPPGARRCPPLVPQPCESGSCPPLVPQPLGAGRCPPLIPQPCEAGCCPPLILQPLPFPNPADPCGGALLSPGPAALWGQPLSSNPADPCGRVPPSPGPAALWGQPLCLPLSPQTHGVGPCPALPWSCSLVGPAPVLP